jgi:flagellar hook-length control protein FliK
MLRLDPPGLGSLSIHLAAGQNGVNVLFVPSVPQTGQLLLQNMDGLRSAMQASGLSLGQAQVGGGGGQNPGNQQPRSSYSPVLIPAPTTDDGVRAYA